MNNNTIKDHMKLFSSDEYAGIFDKKKQYENVHESEKVEKVLEWTKSPEYKTKNFDRKHLVVNPLKSCQPLGALYAASGFYKALPFIHGSQGCAAYFRSHFSRHFKEPCPAVCDSMTEDAAVFGGHNNMYEGLENAYKLYNPAMMIMFTTCMSEVIGDDLNNFIKNAVNKEKIPADLPVVYANTPSFVGSHITGYDNMMLALLKQMGENDNSSLKEEVNVIVGFDTYIQNFREIKRILKLFGLKPRIISDPSFNFDSPADGTFRMYNGGTTIEELKNAPNAKGTIVLQKYSLSKTLEFIKNNWNHKVYEVNPIGIKGTDDLLAILSEISGNNIPEQLRTERGRLVDAITDSYYWIYGKRFSVNADPDISLGLVKYIMELGGEIKDVILTNGTKPWKKEMENVLQSSHLGKDANVYHDKDMWHWRSLIFEDKPDFLIGNSYAKFLVRDTGVPLIRIGFPIFDRHHLHRYSTIGYTGGLNILNWIVNTILDEIDRDTINTPSYDLIR